MLEVRRQPMPAEEAAKTMDFATYAPLLDRNESVTMFYLPSRRSRRWVRGFTSPRMSQMTFNAAMRLVRQYHWWAIAFQHETPEEQARAR